MTKEIYRCEPKRFAPPKTHPNSGVSLGTRNNTPLKKKTSTAKQFLTLEQEKCKSSIIPMILPSTPVSPECATWSVLNYAEQGNKFSEEKSRADGCRKPLENK